MVSRELLIPYLPMLLGTAVFNVKKAAARFDSVTAGERNSYKAYFPVMIDGALINSRMTVKEDDKGDLFWDLRLEDVSRQEIEEDLRKSTGEVISYDDYLAEQRRKAEELAKSRRSRGSGRLLPMTISRSRPVLYQGTDEGYPLDA